MCTGGSVDLIDHRHMEHVRRLQRWLLQLRRLWCREVCLEHWLLSLHQLRHRKVLGFDNAVEIHYLHQLRRRQYSTTFDASTCVSCWASSGRYSPVVYMRRIALADQLRRKHCGTRQFFSRDLTVQRDAQHPCWKAAYFLPCTRPPDVMCLHRPQRRRIHHGASQRLSFVLTCSGLQTMPTGGHGADVDPATVTGATAGNVRRLTPMAP